MLKAQEMTSIIITGQKSMQESIIEELHSLEILHIVEHSKSDLADIGKPLGNAQKYSEVLVKIRAIISNLKIEKKNKKISKHVKGADEAASIFAKVNNEVSGIYEELRQIEASKVKCDSLKTELGILKNIDIPLENLFGYKSLSLFVGFVKNESTSDIKKSISKITSNFTILEDNLSGKTFIILFVDSKHTDNSLDILNKHGFTLQNFSNMIGLKGTAGKNLRMLDEENARLLKRKEEMTKKIEHVKHENSDLLLSSERFLATELEKAEAPLKFASTSSSFMIKGWIPTSDLSRSIERLEKISKKKIYIHFEKPKKHDHVPVKLKNPKLVKPFEFFIDLYSYPSYKEIDPTFFMFLTFPIFFGAILGDVGYGVISLFLFLFLRWKMPNIKNFMNILILSCVASILFGLIYGEAFGYVFLHHPLVHRSAENKMFMPLAIAVGAVHLNIGLILGFFNELKLHGFIHAVFAKLSWIVLQIGVALLALSLISMIHLHWAVGAAVIIVAVFMLLKGEGVRGVIELPSIFSNMLSYARLMAIGLSSVILAEIINDSSKEMIHHGGVMLVGGILVMLVGHTINLLLGLFGSFLHSLRLHYVEFFSKFFHGGAKRYAPFGLKEQ